MNMTGMKQAAMRLAREKRVQLRDAMDSDARFASPPAKALQWIRRNELETGGVRVHHRSPNAYPEVSGYLVPTLLAYGEDALARRVLDWLLCIQHADGAFGDENGNPHIFDTGQVLRGLLAGAHLVPDAADAARRAAAYLCSQMPEGGHRGFGPRYDGAIPETVHLYVLPPLRAAADLLGDSSFADHASRCANFYVKHPDFLRIGDLTHFLAYELDALLDLGHPELAQPTLLELVRLQQPNGAVRGRGPAKWVCSPGLAQLAICWYRIGQGDAADRALAWLEGHQRISGGLLGSYGVGASYFPREELSWAAKFYLDAHLLRVQSFIDRNIDIFPGEVPHDDGRLQKIAALVRSGNRVLEAGCGKGRFLRALSELQPGVEFHGVDISERMLEHLPPSIHGKAGSLERIPHDDETFDVVFSVEAIEHSANPSAAIQEMVRVTRPGGFVVVVDKDRAHWGALACPPWERWPGREELMGLLRRYCDDVSATQVGYQPGVPPDGLMVAWQGRKRSRLTGREWNKALIGSDTERQVLEHVLCHRLTPWAVAVSRCTRPGDRVLEIGSGTGEISLRIARSGRHVTLLDIDASSLAFATHLARKLDLHVEAVAADATQRLPFADGAFDIVWSAGLLEHFTFDERVAMLREWKRIAAREIIILVPNAASLAYHIGKEMQERSGTWPYGLETPLASMEREFDAAGLRMIDQRTIASAHSLAFLPAAHPLRKALLGVFGKAESSWPEAMHQGYLLVSRGSVAP